LSGCADCLAADGLPEASARWLDDAGNRQRIAEWLAPDVARAGIPGTSRQNAR
jgi:hypothetical protein